MTLDQWAKVVYGGMEIEIWAYVRAGYPVKDLAIVSDYGGRKWIAVRSNLNKPLGGVYRHPVYKGIGWP